MELLLLLTALFASLTGASGDRAGVRQLPGVAVVQSAESVRASVQPARRAIPAAAAQPTLRAERVALPLPAPAPVSSGRATPERRRE